MSDNSIQRMSDALQEAYVTYLRSNNRRLTAARKEKDVFYADIDDLRTGLATLVYNRGGFGLDFEVLEATDCITLVRVGKRNVQVTYHDGDIKYEILH